MNKTSLISGTIKGIQIVDLGLNQTGIKNSSKKYMIKLKKNKNSSTNNSVNNDSLISFKENISNKNTSISSKNKQQTTTISSSQKSRKIKSNNENSQLYLNNKNINKNFIKIKLNNQKINNNILPRPLIQKHKNVYSNIIHNNNNEPKVIKKLLSHSKSKKPNTQGNIIRNTFNNKIKKINNNNFDNSENSNNNLNINISTSKKDFFFYKKKIKTEPNTKREIFAENNDFYVPKKNSYILTKEQKRKIKIVFKKILTLNSEVESASFIRSSRHNLEINSSVDSINYRKINKENLGKNNNKKQLIKKMKTNNKTYIVSKDRKNNISKINKNSIEHKNYNSNNIKNNDNMKINFNNNNNNNAGNNNFYEKSNINHHKIYNSNSLGTINDKNKNKNHKLRNLSNIKNSSNNLLNGTLLNINNKMNSTYNNNNNNNKIKRINSSSKSQSKSKMTENNILSINNRYQYNNRKNKNNNKKIINNNESDNNIKNQSPLKSHQISIFTVKNPKNYFNNNNNSNIHNKKEKEKNNSNNSKNELIKKIKINNKSSQKKSTYVNNNINNNNVNNNMNKYKIIKKLKNANINHNNSNKIINLKNDIKFKSYNAFNETSSNTYLHKSSLNPKSIYSNDILNINININNEIKNLNLNSPKHNLYKNKEAQIKTANFDDANFNNNKIISIQKLKINPKYSILKSNDEKKIKKIISISCSIKNQKEINNKKIKVHRRQQSMINTNNKISNNLNNFIINKNKNIKPQMVNIDLQSEFLLKNKIKIKTSVKKFFNKEIPMPAKKIIKKYKKYLKQNEILELKQLHAKGELVYYLGEILERINNKENTFAKINQSFIHENNNENNFFRGKNNPLKKIQDKTLPKNKSSENLRQGKEINYKKIKSKFDNKYYNDEDGDYIITTGTHLNYRYEILESLGKGSFGEAIKCYDHKNKDLVCIKIINSQEKFQNQARTEIKILTLISSHDINNESNNVKFYNYFLFRNHICLVFELLGKNLYEYLQLNNFIGIDITLIKYYTCQILFSLLFLKNLGIIHCDLKPENILIFPNNASQVKVIDFGSSCLETERIYLYIQSRFYRAPEVIFDLGYNYEIDMWSLGCILYELYKGEPLFPGVNEVEQIYLIMEKIGFPPKFIIEQSPKQMLFFDTNLKPYQMLDEDGNYIIPGGKKLKEVLKDAPNSFVDFIAKCLRWNPFERITPDKALLHPFIIENMNGEELYKHKMKIKHIKYGINNSNINNMNNNNENEINNGNNYYYINSTRNKDYYNIINNIKNAPYNKNTKESNKYRGNSCQTKRYKNNKLNNNISNFNINNIDDIKYLNTQNGAEYDFVKKEHKKQSYSVTYGNCNENKYSNNLIKKQKEKNLPLSTEMDENVRRINITENNENACYKRLSKFKEYKKVLAKHLPKKKSFGRIKNCYNKKQKNK